MKQRDKLFKIYINLKNHERKNDLHMQYKQLRNKVLEMIRTKKKEFYKNYFEQNNGNLRKVWQGIREIINVKTKRSDIPTCISSDDNITTCPKEISNKFNDYFSNIAENIIKERKSNSYMPPPPGSIFLHSTTPIDVFCIIN